MRSDYEALKSRSRSQDTPVDPRRVLLVFAVYLYMFVWLAQSMVTKNLWLNDLLRPYLPNWALLIAAFSAPVTLALIGVHSVPWRISILFVLIGCIQAGMLGLVGEKYRFVQGVITIFGFIEAYVLIPRWNRRIAEGKSDGTVLHLR